MAAGVADEIDNSVFVLPATPCSVWHDWLSWTYSGVDPELPGNGGPECLQFLSPSQKLVETVFYVTVGVLAICYAWPRLHVADCKDAVSHGVACDAVSRRVMLTLMCVTFGVEIGFKLASRQLIWILNPCHLVTMMQIYMLVAPPSKTVTAIFRIQMHCLNGATIAILFPILNTRTMPCEMETYYLQHALMLVTPFYLLRLRGPYTPECWMDFSWISLTVGLLFIYHFLPLQCLALLSLVNLNNMMCPAVSDPFYNRWYRVAAATHQPVLMLVHGKAYSYLCLWLSRGSDSPAVAAVDQCGNGAVCMSSPQFSANGFLKTQ